MSVVFVPSVAPVETFRIELPVIAPKLIANDRLCRRPMWTLSKSIPAEP
jgi:hypothetical protein